MRKAVMLRILAVKVYDLVISFPVKNANLTLPGISTKMQVYLLTYDGE